MPCNSKTNTVELLKTSLGHIGSEEPVPVDPDQVRNSPQGHEKSCDVSNAMKFQDKDYKITENCSGSYTHNGPQELVPGNSD